MTLAVGGLAPRSVVLPEPEGPMRADISPAGNHTFLPLVHARRRNPAHRGRAKVGEGRRLGCASVQAPRGHCTPGLKKPDTFWSRLIFSFLFWLRYEHRRLHQRLLRDVHVQSDVASSAPHLLAAESMQAAAMQLPSLLQADCFGNISGNKMLTYLLITV